MSEKKRRKGKLYLVPTPVGNLEDITLRSLRILKEADVIYCEDTRETSKLLFKYEIKTPLKTYLGGEKRKIDEIAKLLSEGKDVAVVSDRGTPGISDPGEKIVKRAMEENVEVECLPGATSFVPALVSSGLSTERFVFEGFLPKSGKERKNRLVALKDEVRTIIFYESPERVGKLVEELKETLGAERRAVIAREISKVHEEYIRGTLKELAEVIRGRKLKGEIILLVAGKEDLKNAAVSGEEIKREILALRKDGFSTVEIAKKLAQKYGLKRRKTYEEILNLISSEREI